MSENVKQKRVYLPRLSAVLNRKGVLDVDTVKGCTIGMASYPNGGCYGVCYANRAAISRGFDFNSSVSRQIHDPDIIENTVKKHPASWFRIGCMGDPCHDWDLTLEVCKWLGKIKTPVIVTKHWKKLSTDHLIGLRECGAVVNTSTSPLDTELERKTRLSEFERIRENGVRSVLRIVSCGFANTERGQEFSEIQRQLFEHTPNIDNPLRINRTDSRVVKNSGQGIFEIPGANFGFINTCKRNDLGGGSFVSVFNKKSYIGKCTDCPDQCGIDMEATQ